MDVPYRTQQINSGKQFYKLLCNDETHCIGAFIIIYLFLQRAELFQRHVLIVHSSAPNSTATTVLSNISRKIRPTLPAHGIFNTYST